jgi:hypothetical protein
VEVLIILVSIEMVENLELETTAHLNPYKVSWLQKGHQVMVSRQCKVEFKIGGYRDEILCDVIPMDVCHVLLGRPWKYDRNVIHDGRKNTYTLEKNGHTHMLFPIEDKEVKEEASSSILLMSGKEPLKEEENPQYCNLRIGEINISLKMNFTYAHACEEVMQKTSQEEAKEPRDF